MDFTQQPRYPYHRQRIQCRTHQSWSPGIRHGRPVHMHYRHQTAGYIRYYITRKCQRSCGFYHIEPTSAAFHIRNPIYKRKQREIHGTAIEQPCGSSQYLRYYPVFMSEKARAEHHYSDGQHHGDKSAGRRCGSVFLHYHRCQNPSH